MGAQTPLPPKSTLPSARRGVGLAAGAGVEADPCSWAAPRAISPSDNTPAATTVLLIEAIVTPGLCLLERQEPADAKVVDGRSNHSAEERADDRNPEHRRAVGKPVIFETRRHGAQARAEIARWIDRVPM